MSLGVESGFVPEGLSEVAFGGGTFIGCEHVGSLASIGETTAWFYRDRLPSTSYCISANLIWRSTANDSTMTVQHPS